jgi:hypothetical protein
MKKILYIVLISIFSLTVVSCSKKDSSSSSSDPKKITGTLGTGYSVNRSASSRFTSSSSDNSSQTANQVWAIPISRTKPYEGTSNVSLNYSIMLQEGHASKMGRQIFNIASDGTFALDVYLNCNPTSTMECLGYIFVLVDSTKTEKKDHIIGFLSLGGTDSLVSIPVADLKDNLDMGTLNQGSYDNETGDNSSDEAIGKTIDETADRFATFTSDQLKIRASADDYVKISKNMYVNSTSDFSEFDGAGVGYKYLSTIVNDVYTDFDNATYLGAQVSIGLRSANTLTTDGTMSYTLTPPGTTYLRHIYDNGTVDTSVEYNSSNPFVLDVDSYTGYGSLDSNSIAVALDGNRYYLSTIPEGVWILTDNNSSTLGYYDLSLTNPIGSDNYSKTYVPSIKLETNSESKVSKVHLKWYLHNGTSYYEVTDLTSFWENASQVTVGVNDQDNSYGETHNLIGSNKTEVTLTKPITNPSVTIAYGFYSSEIQVRYSY